MRRAGTAAVLLAILLAALFFLPRNGVALLMAIITAIGGHEWARICGLAATSARAYAAAIVVMFGLGMMLDDKTAVFLLAALFWVLAAPLWMWRGVKAEHRSALLATGFVVLVPAALAMVVLRPGEALTILAVAWIADTGAYFAGRRWGRRKLAPAISPGKTWEGAAGGLVGAVAYAMILALFLAGAQASRMAVFLGAATLLVMVSIVGDLFESAAKRQAGLKDSGALLPGHGGMLDRIDSVCAILPVGAALVLLKVSA